MAQPLNQLGYFSSAERNFKPDGIGIKHLQNGKREIVKALKPFVVAGLNPNVTQWLEDQTIMK